MKWLSGVSVIPGTKGCQLGSWSGHMPGLLARTLVWGSHQCFSPFLSPSLPFYPPKIIRKEGRKEGRKREGMGREGKKRKDVDYHNWHQVIS